MTRPTDWSALDLDGDPTPGEPATIRELAHHVSGIAEAIRSSLGRFSELNCTEDFWKSDAAEGFKEIKGELPGDLEMAAERYENVAGALDGWIEALGGVQSRADDALRRANDARDDLAYANSGIDDMGDWKEQAERTAREHNEAHPGETPVEPEPWSGQDFYALKRDAEERLGRAKEDVGNAKTDRDSASDHAGQLIEDAANDELKNKPWWRKALLVVSDILTVVTAIVGILAIFFPVLAPLALGLALLSLALTAVLVATGDKSWGDLALELVGLATLGLGRLAIAGVRAYRAASAMRTATVAATRARNATRTAQLATRVQRGFAHPNYPRGSIYNFGSGQRLSGAALASYANRFGGRAAAAAQQRAAAAWDDLARANDAWRAIRYPPAPTFSGTFGSWSNVGNTAMNSIREMGTNLSFTNGAAGLGVIGADVTGTGITVDQVAGVGGDHWNFSKW